MSDTVSGPTADTAPQPMQPLAGGPPAAGGGAASPVLAALARARGTAQPTAPGMGTQASSLMQVKQAVDMLQTALPGLGAGSEAHTAVLNALRQLSRHIPQGAPTAGVQQTQLQDMLRNTVRNALLQRIMAQSGGGGGGGQAPMTPSTPLPGA